MGNAIWLFFALPDWYFSSIASPFEAGALSEIPALGIVGLAVGIVWGLTKRRLDLLIFLWLPAATEALVVVAGFMRGSLSYKVSETIFWIFPVFQIAIAGYFVFRLAGARLPAAALAIFTSSYAWFGTFVAAMSFSDIWI